MHRRVRAIALPMPRKIQTPVVCKVAEATNYMAYLADLYVLFAPVILWPGYTIGTFDVFHEALTLDPIF